MSCLIPAIRPFRLVLSQRDLAGVATAAQAVAHIGDDPRRFIDLLFVAADHGGALRHEVCTSACQGDVKAVDAALNAQPFGTGGGQWNLRG